MKLFCQAIFASLFCLFLATPGQAETFTAAQAGGTGSGGSTNYGQSFTASVAGDGMALSSGTPDNVFLTSFTLFAGGSNGNGAHYLNIYDGLIDTSDSGPGNFIGSSTDTVTFGGQSPDDPMTWNFDNLLLDYDGGTKYFAVLSTSSTAGGITDGGQNFRLRNTGVGAPDDYSGGELLHADGQLFTHDARFTATFETVPEPRTIASLLAALLALGIFAARRR